MLYHFRAEGQEGWVPMACLCFNSQSCNYEQHSQIICIFLDDWLNSGCDTWLLALLVGARHAIKASDKCKQPFPQLLSAANTGCGPGEGEWSCLCWWISG